MEIYRQHLFPKLLDYVLSKPNIALLRRELLADVKGDILELGFGTGLNLPCYPPSVHRLTVLDPNPGMNLLAKKRISASKIEVISSEMSAENMPFPSGSFDTVVSTWTLCSIPDYRHALQEVARVLKPGGKFIFLEHGVSREASVQKWQNRLYAVNKLLTDGCCVNRDIVSAVSEVLEMERWEEFYFGGYPRTHGYFYRGIAKKIVH